MIFGSVCSGVEAASVAWKPLGWEAAWFCENDAFPSAVLNHHYPDVPNLGDMTKIEERTEYNDRAIQLLVGGTPCQSFSVAGLRKGLDDDRGNLALKFCKILRDRRPRWFIWENVPGVLSSNGGSDFHSILRGFQECGYGFAYRILDAQFFGVPQRRRRVFVVVYLGDWRPPVAVLFERDSLRGYPPPSRKAGKNNSEDFIGDADKTIVIDRAGFNQGENALYDPYIEDTTTSPALVARGPHAILAYRMIGFGDYVQDETASPVKARDFKDSTDLINDKNGVRKYTPIECERLQGFPDNYTMIPWRGKNAELCPDGPRYKAMGNSMAVPVMQWIGKRIDMFEELPL